MTILDAAISTIRGVGNTVIGFASTANDTIKANLNHQQLLDACSTAYAKGAAAFSDLFTNTVRLPEFRVPDHYMLTVEKGLCELLEGAGHAVCALGLVDPKQIEDKDDMQLHIRGLHLGTKGSQNRLG